MRNKDLPKLLELMANSEDAKKHGHNIIFAEAAIELKKLDAIESLMLSIAASKQAVLDVINDRAFQVNAKRNDK